MNRVCWRPCLGPLMAALLLGLTAGCGGRTGGGPPTVAPLRIGAILPMTGQASGYGKWMERGIDLAVEDVNASGGISGRKLEVIVEDSKSDNRAGVDAANKLTSVDHVPVIMTTLTGVTQAVIPVTERSKVILFTSATAPGLTEQGKYVFRNATNVANEVDRMVSACKDDLHLGRVAMIYLNNPVGVWAHDYFRKSFASIGGELVAAQSFQPDATDFRTQLLRVKAADPEALYIMGYQQDGLIMKQARELGIRCQFLGAIDCELPEVIRIAGPAAEGTIYTKASFDATSGDAAVRSFAVRYRERYGEEPEVYGATMYDATRIIADAIRAVGTNPDRLRAHILAIKGYLGVSGTTTFLPNGDVQKPVELKMIKDGKYVVVH